MVPTILTLELANEHAEKPKEELSVLFDEEVERFSNYMANLGDFKAAGSLSKMEKALVKTFLIFKLKEKT